MLAVKTVAIDNVCRACSMSTVAARRTLSADESPWNCGVSCDAAATPTQAVTVKPLRRDTIFSPSRCSMANSFLAAKHRP